LHTVHHAIFDFFNIIKTHTVNVGLENPGVLGNVHSYKLLIMVRIAPARTPLDALRR
jgi:hypothetical protein